MKTLDRIKSITTPFVFGVAFIALWEGAVEGFDLKPYFLAAPSKIIEQFFNNTARIWEATAVSGGNA